MKRKVKKYAGGMLVDSSGNPVRSSSGEPVRTRYGKDDEDRPKAGADDYATMGARAGATSPFSGPKEYISESVKEESIKEPETDTEEPRRKISDYISTSSAKENVKPAVKKKVTPKADSKRGSQSFPLKDESRGSQSFPIGEGSKTLPGKPSDKEDKPQTLPGKPNAKEYYRDFSGKIKEKTPDESSFKNFKNMISEGAGSLGRGISNYASTIKSPAQRRDEEKASKEKGFAKGGKVSSASSRGDGIAQRGKTKGRMC
jgi:hypothetical protein